MIIEALNWYVESLSAFWVGLAGGGLVKLILILCFIYWMCCRRGRCGRHRCHGGCSHCGCWCGGCACGVGEAGEDGAEEEEDGEAAAEAEEV